MSQELIVLALGGAIQSALIVAVLAWFEHLRRRRLRREPGTVEHLASEIRRVEREGVARMDALDQRVTALVDRDEDLNRMTAEANATAIRKEVFDAMSEGMYKAAEDRVLGKRKP